MKEFKTYQEQIELLKIRGLKIDNEQFALKKLKEDNYYSIINGYKDLFLNSLDRNKYLNGTTFEEVYALFEFDRNIKSILLKNILVVENILRTLIAYNFSEKYGNDNYLKIDNFETLKCSGCSKKTYQERIEQIQKLICNMQMDISNNIKKKPYINHYVLNYGFVPLWVLVNAISLGRLSQFYSLMDQSVRVKVSMHWNVMENDLNQFIKNLSYFRNLCAHDERLYNSFNNQNIPDTIYHNSLNLKKISNNYIQGKNDLFSLLITLKMLLPEEKFNTLCNQLKGRMISLTNKISTIDVNLVFDCMGFPKNWFNIKKS
jgi:abortive infection bacteriophage resistance protein